MKSLFYLTIASFTALLSSSCTTASKTPAKSSYYIDVHEFGAGKVTAAAVAAASIIFLTRNIDPPSLGGLIVHGNLDISSTRLALRCGPVSGPAR